MSNVRGSVKRRLRTTLPPPAFRFLRRGYLEAQKLARRNPGRGRLLPDFIIIGAAKSGTTSLYGALAEHPFVEPCVTDLAYFRNTKEVHFFDYNFDRGEDWYRSHFPLERKRLEFEREHGRPFLTGESSPSYISHLWAPQRVRRVVPDVRLIAVFRNPADRAYSQFQMSRREGEDELESFEEAIASEEARLAPELTRMRRDQWYTSWNYGCWSYLSRSRYAEQVERWLALFPREQFLFLKAEDFFARPERVFDDVCTFLGLPQLSPEALPRLNVSAEYQHMPPETRARIADYFRPHNERLYELTGIDMGWERDEAPAVGVG
jgi:Sulfotransferase domain